MMALKFLTIVNASVTLVFFCLSIYELIVIAIKALGHDSFQAINELKFEELVAPSITLCPGPAFKRAGPFLGEQEFTDNKYTWEEIFHPKTLYNLDGMVRWPIQLIMGALGDGLLASRQAY